MRKKVLALLICSMTLYSTTVHVSASSLDDIVNSKTEETQITQETQDTQETQETQETQDTQNSTDTVLTYDSNDNYIENLKEATKIQESKTAKSVNKYISAALSFCIQVVSYLATALLGASVVVDLLYILVPILRKILANGHMGTAQIDNNQQNNSFGGGGFGSGGFGSGGFGNSFGNSGFGNSFGGGFGNNQAQQQNHILKLQIVSDGALNAVASEKSGGSSKKALSIYGKDMTIKLVVAPVLIVLAVSGVLTNLGIFLGETIVSLIGAMISMV